MEKEAYFSEGPSGMLADTLSGTALVGASPTAEPLFHTGHLSTWLRKSVQQLTLLNTTLLAKR